MYSVRCVQLVVENCSLVHAICIKLLYLQRYGIECAIFDEYGYLVPLSEQNDALEEVYKLHHKVHPLSGII